MRKATGLVDTISFDVVNLSTQHAADPFGNLGNLPHKYNSLKAGVGCVGILSWFEEGCSYDVLGHWLIYLVLLITDIIYGYQSCIIL